MVYVLFDIAGVGSSILPTPTIRNKGPVRGAFFVSM